MTNSSLDCVSRLFVEGRSFNTWQDKPVSVEMLQSIMELVKFGPTAANGCPLRVRFIYSADAKIRLLPALAPANRIKSQTAPVIAVLGMDLNFPMTLPRLFPHAPHAADAYAGQPELTREVALRNSSLQVGYFIVAARAHGLDCGPMSGFDKAMMDEAFWSRTTIETNMICNHCYGKREDIFNRYPRLSIYENCTIL